ncbi:ribosomal RNA small subunit methyltransferase A [bacterium]|nr:ribosomal RNA small subunit methyltransferase A [bacterium]MDP6571741.1 16S rRNA (adenine(1518)-N(6)/adenine(1519)-N(6))-dimethyltransferase RsmA [Patescibacteria group bacterium]|tara:strand:+ start:1848 stop:2693 length:846 start_codon:yes stop_codon:yes gene_type:complete
MNLTDVRTIKNLASKYNISPSQDRGQNFLIDEKILNSIIKLSNIKKQDNILEIGPGFGVLTNELLSNGAKVLAIESDKKFSNHLAKQYSKKKNFKLEQKDILKISNQEISNYLGKDYRVISNIPYQITGKIIKKFISSDLPKPESALLLVQKEVADRINAGPGKMSLLGISVQLYAKPKIVLDVPKESFWPAPKVDSCLLEISRISSKPNYDINEDKFWQLARIGFSSPRKQLRNNIANSLNMDQEAVKSALKKSGLKHTARSQELSIEQWISFLAALERN